MNTLSPIQLIYSATARCLCGAGLAYEPRSASPMSGSWICSAVLLGQVQLDEQRSAAHNATRSKSSWHNEAVDTAGQTHTGYPFTLFNIKSEAQPSASGATTRPSGTHVEWEPHCKCKQCGHEWVMPPRSPNMRSVWYEGLDCPKCGAQRANPDGSTSDNIEVRMKDIVIDDLRQRTQELRQQLKESNNANTGDSSLSSQDSN